MIVGLKKARILGVQNIVINCNSQLVANQLIGEYAARNQRMEAYMKLAKRLFKRFNSAYIERFPRTSNSHVDALATFASKVDSNMKRTIEVEFLSRPSIDAEHDCLMVFDVEADLGVRWIDPIIHYLKNGSFPSDSAEAYRIRAQASRY